APAAMVARATEPDAPTPAPPTVTPESLGIGPASFEWLFGDPEKALTHPDVTAGPTASLPALSPEERAARRVARLTARGGSAYGRGARISEGPALPPGPSPEPRAPEPGVPEPPAPEPRAPESPTPMLQR